MRVSLLYRDRDPERLADGTYYDEDSIIRDLGLSALFRTAAQRVIYEYGKVTKVDKEDRYITETMRKLMLIPLFSKEEIEFRQAVVKDSFRQEDLIRGLYEISSETVRKWNHLGRGSREQAQQRNPVINLMNDIQVFHVICDTLSEIRMLFDRKNPATGRSAHEDFDSDGLRSLYERFCEAYPPERERTVRRILKDIAFYTNAEDEQKESAPRTLKPRIVLECGLEDGLKFSSLKLADISSESIRFYRPGTTMKKLQEFTFSRIPDSFPVEWNTRLTEQAKQLEFGVVSYLTDKVLSGIKDEFRNFFDQLMRQSAFYLGTIQLMDQLKLREISHCFPEAADRNVLQFRNLKECAMGMDRRMTVIGNTCAMDNKDLLIVTGANQGGKSTFLRSIGLAQIMMQCGMPVAANMFRSGIFPRIFVHFTRREDSSMNSGRLDEELNRMNRIVEHIGDGSLVLLNESVATTTEKDGSVIAYDIVRALNEAGVKILMVTHLLSFAKRMYEQTKENPDSVVEFLSAERKPDGRRTFRMIQHVPEMTSFGLDLYEEIVEGKKAD